MAALGAFLGWNAVPWILAAASIIGACHGLFLVAKRKRKLGVKVPFGPYLAVAAFVWFTFGYRFFIGLGE